ncbi:DUF305 domain-containing protein [Streptomyces sp. CB03238]|uniref:DUF305 domain-containing protein n=1 Tax=Streptomyces sp. CB03238 TaxID=1907777 RepID=UPI000A10385D|nr:DUF305 domain-containing protein [Streptomyces sp. CB03238]ORT56751.1 DUF305 domain-containing protein [Streptomyces sp. CB03238]
MTARRLLRTRKAAASAAAVTAAALVLAACGTDGGDSSGHAGHGSAPATSSPSAERGGHNAADVAFAQGMIPHHRQAVDMADMAAERASAKEVKELAAAIRKAQDPEIRTMSGWLTSWGEQVPGEDASADHSGHGDGTTGMMTEQEMEQLEKSSGKAFDTAFLQLMIKHHQGAVAMAKTEQAKGSYQPAKDMAGDIIASQSAEITEMNKLLGTD